MELPTEPKGVWCFWHQEDLSPVSLHGGSIASKFKEFGQKLKKVGRVFAPLKRNLGDYPIAGIGNDPPVPYVTLGNETRGDVTYQVVTVSFYYKDNPATGPGWEANPTDPKLGYHESDMEFVSIYYLDSVPNKVFFSAHSIGGGNGTWVNYSECEFRSGFLVVYIARNSHACYPHSGTHWRIYGFANDVTSSSGPNKPYTWSEMTTSYDWNNGHGITLYKGLRPPPPDFSKSDKQRVLYGL